MQDVPWIVFAERAYVYMEPNPSATAFGSCKEGHELRGELQVHGEEKVEWLQVVHNNQTAYVLRAYLLRIHPDNQKLDGDIPYGTEVVNRWWGLPLHYEPSDLVQVPQQWGYEADRVYRVRQEVCEAVVAMLEAAQKDGEEIRVASDYRSGVRQRELYLNAINKDGPGQRYSAPPGHSEHQLGTTVDLCDPAGEYLFSQEYDQTPGGAWLEKNAPSFGFRRSYYPHNVEETGYISEPWHWRYIGKP